MSLKMREQRQQTWIKWRRLEKKIRASNSLYDPSLLRGYSCKNDGYGELLPIFAQQLVKVLNITASTRVLDVGSGIGFLALDLACLTGCSVKGIEIRRDLYLKSSQIAKHVREKGINLDVTFMYGDATNDSFHFKNMDLIVCCNTLWSGENNYRLLQKLSLQMRPGTRVVVLEQLGGQRYHAKSPRQQGDLLSNGFELPAQKFMSDPEAVSWTHQPIAWYVYTKKRMDREIRMRAEQDFAKVLKTPKHRTDPHVESELRKRGPEQMSFDEEDDDESEGDDDVIFLGVKNEPKTDDDTARRTRPAVKKATKPTRKAAATRRGRTTSTTRRVTRSTATTARTTNLKIGRQTNETRATRTTRPKPKATRRSRVKPEPEPTTRLTRSQQRELEPSHPTTRSQARAKAQGKPIIKHERPVKRQRTTPSAPPSTPVTPRTRRAPSPPSPSPPPSPTNLDSKLKKRRTCKTRFTATKQFRKKQTLAKISRAAQLIAKVKKVVAVARKARSSQKPEKSRRSLRPPKFNERLNDYIA